MTALHTSIAIAPRRASWLDAVLWLFLVSPVLVEAALWRELRPLGAAFVLNLFASLLWVSLLRSFGIAARWLHLALLPLYLTTAADLFLLIAFGNRLSSGYIGLAITDHGELREFVTAYATPLIACAAALALALAVAAFGVHPLRYRRRPRVLAVSVAGLAALYLGLFAFGTLRSGDARGSVWDVASKDLSAPFGVISQAAVAMRTLWAGDAALAAREAHRFEARKTGDWGAEVHVLVIGESSRAQNWSLLGYSRDTTPRLRAQPGVVALPDLLSTAPHTAVAVPSMLSLQPIDDWRKVLAQRSIVSAFDAAGFRTHWLSAQEADSWGGIIPRIAAEAQRRRYFDRQLDGAMLPEYTRLVEEARAGRRLMIVLHTKGSHWNFEQRYPGEFERFVPAKPGERERLVAAYDNSIAYTDWLLAELITRLDRAGLHASLTYASDHGENLLDDERRLFGHALGNEYDLKSAGFIWLSQAARANLPAAAARLEANARRRVSLADLPHSMLDLAGIEVRGRDVSRSLYSAAYRERPRRFIVRGELRTEAPRVPADAAPTP